MMIDGRADMHVMRFEPDPARECSRPARPVLEAHGTPARRYVFDRLFTQQRLIRNRFRVDDADLARLYSSLRLAEHTGEEQGPRVRHALSRLGPVAARRPAGGQAAAGERRYAMAERMGETFLRAVSLLVLTLTALRQHDTEAVRAPPPAGRRGGRERPHPADRDDGVPRPGSPGRTASRTR